jgi:hypothetical protein
MMGTGKPLKRDFENESFEFAIKAICRESVTGRVAARYEKTTSFKD